ncbi:uncharacterized protein LOC128955315 [Oppia nitens]|uniref:uncharacterized protein LOC128955315 n=1 Tax=Oppia nitens TaxID=1686743 RepID=UPI0023D9E883|nr:uncharacterized protein LOC128955315 [Oppia nitens]
MATKAAEIVMSAPIVDRFVDDLNRYLRKCLTDLTDLDDMAIDRLIAILGHKNSCQSLSTLPAGCCSGSDNSRHLINNCCFKSRISQESGAKTKGDFSLYLPKAVDLLFPHLIRICDQLVVDSSSRQLWTFAVNNYRILDCNDSSKRIQFNVCRKTGAVRLVDEFTDLLSNLEKIVDNDTNNSVSKICVVKLYTVEDDNDNRFLDERLDQLSRIMAKLLHTDCLIEIKYRQIPDQVIDEMIANASDGKLCTISGHKVIFTDQLVIPKTSKLVFEMVVNLYDSIKYHLKSDNSNPMTIVIIVAESLSHRLKQAFQVMCILYDILNVNLQVVPVSGVHTDQTYDDYLQSLRDQLIEQNFDSDITSENIDLIVKTSLTLSLLTTRPSLPISRVDPYLNEAIFIQYNCARLMAIIRRYRTDYLVANTNTNGQEDRAIDIGLLTDDLEWTLIFRGFTKFKSIIGRLDIVELSSISHQTPSRLIVFIKQLVNDISVYYKKVKVLTEPSQHLLTLIATRVYFCQLLYKLLANCLNLFGLKPIDSL